MFLLAAAVLTAMPTAPPIVERGRAHAMVRIVSSAALRFSEIEKYRPQLLRKSILRSADGSAQSALLVEFQ